MRTLALALLVTLAACQPPGPTYHQDLKPLLDARCVNCHVSGGIAPFALDTWEAAVAKAPAIADAVQSGRMPPWHAGPADVTYLRNPSLTDAQKATVAAWALSTVEGTILFGEHLGALAVVGLVTALVGVSLTLRAPAAP